LNHGLGLAQWNSGYPSRLNRPWAHASASPGARVGELRHPTRATGATAPCRRRRHSRAGRVPTPLPSPTGYKRSTPGGEIQFSFLSLPPYRALTRCLSLPASRRSNPPPTDSSRLEHLQGSPVLLPWLLQLELSSSDLYVRSCHCLPPFVSELPSLHRSSLISWLKGCLKSSTYS
jgi:hypothetical protein